MRIELIEALNEPAISGQSPLGSPDFNQQISGAFIPK